MSRMLPCLVALVSTLPAVAGAGEVVYQFRSQEDAKAADASGCQSAPFEVNVRLPASLYASEAHPGQPGKVGPGQKRVGTALACVRIVDRTFAEGSRADFWVRFELPEGRFTAVGQCTMVSNAVPRAGVVLASCALKLTEFPAAYAGGFATSASIFNPKGLPGYNTGSLWTVRAFEPEPVAPAPAPKP